MHTQYNKYTYDDNNTHKTTTTIHTRQLQQYTRPTNNNYTQDNLKLATIYTSFSTDLLEVGLLSLKIGLLLLEAGMLLPLQYDHGVSHDFILWI